jgi:CubicO group peptidase (beta-lactamase class C family)
MRLLSLIVMLVSSVTFAQNCPTRAAWPTAGWPTQLVDRTAKAAQVKALEDAFFTLDGADGDRKGLRTDGLVIIKGGTMVYEKYGRTYDETKPHISWSVAKSVSSALVGVAVKQKALTLDDSICKYVSGYSGQICDIHVKDPITFGTGLAWQEGYENEPYQTSSVISMLYGVGHGDQIKHILTHKLDAAPGTRWMYSTGDAELASTIAKNALIGRFGKDAFWTLFFDKIGMTSAVVEEDGLGAPQGGSMVYATPRDYAKFGFLFLNDGCWNGERLLPEGWVKSSTTPSEVFVASAPESEDTPSGYSWWLNRPIPAAPRLPRAPKGKPWKDSPDDTYTAIGHWGQYVVVVPSQDLVIVRTGDDRNKGLDINQLVTLSMEVAQ